MKEIIIPTLEAEDIEVKIKTVRSSGAQALLYKTARTDMDYLDKYIGPYNWQCDYTEIKGNLYCTISIWDEEKKQWINKMDCGIESREDDEGNQKKGEASDAFKRANTKATGCGRELYTSPFIWLRIETEKDDHNKWKLKDSNAKYIVTEIGYDSNRHINKLIIVNEKTGEIVYRYGSNDSKNEAPKSAPKKATKPATEPKADVEVSKTLPEKPTPPHQQLFQSFLEKHHLNRKQFIDMRTQALQDGKQLPKTDFMDMTPDEWVKLLALMESLYVEGYYKDVA